MIYVTHDQVEAMTMADKIVVLNAGRIEQVGSPLELYQRPANLFVAGSIGSPKMNFIASTASSGAGRIAVALPGGGIIALPEQGVTVAANQPVTLGIRPEHLAVGGKGDATLNVTLRLAKYLGSETMFYTSLADGGELSVKADDLAQGKPGAGMAIGIPAAACHLFDSNGRALIDGDLTK